VSISQDRTNQESCCLGFKVANSHLASTDLETHDSTDEASLSGVIPNNAKCGKTYTYFLIETDLKPTSYLIIIIISFLFF
jgi:hypothetical protein